MNDLAAPESRLSEAYLGIGAALDKVPAGRENVFLAKLLLVLCREIDVSRVHEGIRIALQDIEYCPVPPRAPDASHEPR